MCARATTAQVKRYLAMILYVLFAALAFAAITVFLVAYTRRVANVALTDHFRAGEAIANGHIPNQWVVQIKRRLAWGQRLPFLKRDVSGTDLALEKMDTLYRFFEKSPFFENAAARRLLLGRLREMRERWERMAWHEVVSEYADAGASAKRPWWTSFTGGRN